jgi:hypothetical protein
VKWLGEFPRYLRTALGCLAILLLNREAPGYDRTSEIWQLDLDFHGFPSSIQFHADVVLSNWSQPLSLTSVSFIIEDFLLADAV